MRKVLGIFSLIIFAFFLLGSSQVIGKTYTWVDKSGRTRFTDYPPPPDQVMKTNRTGQRSYNKKVTSPKVELYIASWCPYCKKAINYFESRGIRYKAYDIEKNEKAAKRKKKLDKKEGIPFAVINGEYIHGYAPELYAEALKKK